MTDNPTLPPVEEIRAEARGWAMTKPNRAHRLNRAADALEAAQRRVSELEAALAQANADILTTLGALRDDILPGAVAIFQRIARDCAALAKDETARG